MSNSYGSNPIVLDTFTSAIDVGSTMFNDSNAAFKIDSIEWENPVTVADTAIVTDGASNPIFSKTCAVAKESIIKYFRTWFRGIKIGASGVSSGKIVITIR